MTAFRMPEWAAPGAVSRLPGQAMRGPNEWTFPWEGRTFVEILWGPVLRNTVDLQMSIDNGMTWTTVVAGITYYGTYC